MTPHFAYWVTWGFSTVMSVIYAGCALATFNNITKVGVEPGLKSLKYGMLASCFLGFILVIMFAMTSACVAIMRHPHGAGHPPPMMYGGHMPVAHHMKTELGQGVLIGSAIHMIFFMLLAGLALHTGDSWAENRFGSSMSYQTFRAAYGFAYLLSIMYIAFFFVIVCARQHHPHGAMGMGMGMGMGMPGTVHMAAVPTAMPMATTMAHVPDTRMIGTMPMAMPAGYPPPGYY